MQRLILTLTSVLLSATTFAIEPIVGEMSICVRKFTFLGDATAGGKWSSSNTSVATIDAGGVATGLTAGTTTITYKVGAEYVTALLTINPLPGPIIGPTTITEGTTATLSNAASGGTWTSAGSVYIDISPTGVAYGIAPGMEAVIYTLPTGCKINAVMAVAPAVYVEVTDTMYISSANKCTFSGAVTGGQITVGDTLTIKMERDMYNTYTITNNIGQEKIKGEVHAPMATLFLKSLPPGFYYFKLTGDNGSKVQKLKKK